MYLINSFSISRLNNAEITGLLINIQKLISQSTSAAIGIEDEVNTAYNNALRLLVDQVYTNQGSQHTAAHQFLGGGLKVTKVNPESRTAEGGRSVLSEKWASSFCGSVFCQKNGAPRFAEVYSA